jgi:hypothetical protein
MMKAIKAIVHKGASVDEAFDIYSKLAQLVSGK